MKKLVILAAVICLMLSYSFALAEDVITTPGTAENVQPALEEQVPPIEFVWPDIDQTNFPPSSADSWQPEMVAIERAIIDAPYVVDGIPSMTPPPDIVRDEYRGDYNELDTWHTVNFDDVFGAPTIFVNTIRLTHEYYYEGVVFQGPGGLDGGALLDYVSFTVTGMSTPNALCFNTGATLMDGGIPQGPQTMLFYEPVSSVSMNVGHASGGDVWLYAYDVDGNWLGSDWITSTTAAQNMSIVADDIAKVELYFDGTVLVVDDIEYNTMDLVTPMYDVALIMDDPTWWGNGVEDHLDWSWKIDYTVYGSADLSWLDLSGYDVVIVNSEQDQTFYNNLALYMNTLEDYVVGGGWLQFNGATNAHSPQWELWDGTGYTWDLGIYNDPDNWAVWPEHPILMNMPDPITGNQCNHGYLSGYPINADVILETTAGEPTMIEYDVGPNGGHVLIHTLTMEYGQSFGYGNGLLIPTTIEYSLSRHTRNLLWASHTVNNSVMQAMDDAGVNYHYIHDADCDWDNFGFIGYLTVMLAMDGGTPTADDVQIMVDYINNGGMLNIYGGSNWMAFYDGITAMIDHTGVTGWVQNAIDPDISVIDAGHPLVQGLPNLYNYVNNSASWYMIRIDDPLDWVGAENGDGHPILVTKDVGSGHLQWFTSSARDLYWGDPNDYAICQTVVHNMYVGGGPPPPLILNAWPAVDPTILNPPGTFGWNAFVQNVSGGPYTFDAWTALTLPWGMPYGPLNLFTGLMLPDGGVLVAAPNQFVPGFAPPGVYTYHAVVGDYWAGDIVAEQTFPFTIVVAGPTVAGNFNADGWVLTDFIEVDELDTPEFSNAIPTDYIFETPYPNPFNPTTTVSIGLPDVSSLTLVVTNVLGQTVAILANDYFDAGYHQFTFDAHGLSSGLYFVHALVPGELNQVQKVILVR